MLKRKFLIILVEQTIKTSSWPGHENGQFTIITREATEQNLKIHHRQPVIISKSQINNYFNLNNNAVEFLNSIKPMELKFHEVSTKVTTQTQMM